MMRRRGRVFADHYFSRLLETPTELVKTIRYVLANHSHHFGQAGIDPYSSTALDRNEREVVLALPTGWLLRVGWRRARRRDLCSKTSAETALGSTSAPPARRLR